jgi:hypothetical protein
MTHTCTAGDPANGQANPVLTKSAIIDITPPTVTLSAPATGGLYGIGAAVPVHFTCADNVAVATCQGTVANGANLSTATAGVKTLSATSTDAAGNFAEKFASVRVVQTTFTTRYENSQLPLLDATAAFFNTDRSGLARLGVSAIRSLIAANPPTTPAVPPVNTGPVAVMTSYTPAEGQVVGENAALVGLTGDELHKSGVLFATYFYVTSGA